jgi:ADP-L-glycero-D-manno-heptose 6-epimerase
MLLVTGGAGFIGSNVVASLNEGGRADIAVNDVLGSDGKWRNLAGRQIADFVPPQDLMHWLDGRKLEAVIHLGAISSTTVTDGDAVMENNFRLSLRLFDWCASARTPFIYASSAATYGNGDQGYSDDWSNGALKRLKPMNLYGWSKQLFDLAVVDRVRRKDRLPPQWAGLKFFNVFGPNEYHKGDMMSLVAKRFDEKRDFIYVDDAIAVVRWLVETPAVSGIFNVGTGIARSFRDLMIAMFAALGREPAIEYIDMPLSIRDSYQYFTQAETENLRRAGYNANFTLLDVAVKRYVNCFLDRPDRYR